MWRVGRRPLPLLELWNRPHDGSDGRTVFGLDHDACARMRSGVGWKVANRKRVRPSDGRQLHRDEPDTIRRDHGCTYIGERLGVGADLRGPKGPHYEWS